MLLKKSVDEKSQPGPIDLTVDQEAYQPLVSEHGGKRKFSLSAVKGGAGFAQRFAMHARLVFVRCVTHRRVIAVKVERAHGRRIITRDRWQARIHRLIGSTRFRFSVFARN